MNFDPQRLQSVLAESEKILAAARELAGEQGAELTAPAPLPEDLNALVAAGEADGIMRRRQAEGDDAAGLQELLTYGLKGTAAYADHAAILGRADEAVNAFFHEALSFLAGEPAGADDLLAMCLRCGEINLKAMALLDAANTGAFGDPAPTPVRIDPVRGKAILISGHDLLDLEALLKQTEGKGINVYTHGEMLPAHGYPKLKRYRHLAGNYGGAWQDQRKGIRGISRSDPDDHQLHSTPAGILSKSDFHLRFGGLAGCASYRQTRFCPGH